jgi:hypothetical protein
MTASFAMSRLGAALDGVEFHQAGVIFTVDGTVYPGAPVDFPAPGSGFSSDMAFGLMDVADGLWIWEGIGYPAAMAEMGKSVQVGRINTVQRILRYRVGTKIVLTGYSQGAMVVDQVWVKDCLDPAGVLHDRFLNGDIVRIYNYGDPFRSPGIAHGNELVGFAVPGVEDGAMTGGIGGVQDLRANESNVLAFDGRPVLNSFARSGDIYAVCPVGTDPWKRIAGPGRVGNSIFKVVMHASVLSVVAVAADLAVPVGMVEEIINGIQCASAGSNAPHWQYWPEMQAAIGEMVDLGHKILAAA